MIWLLINSNPYWIWVKCRLCCATRIKCVGFRIGTDPLLESLLVQILLQLFIGTISTLWNTSAMSEHNLLLPRQSPNKKCQYKTLNLYCDLQRVISLVISCDTLIRNSLYIKVVIRLTFSQSESLGVDPHLGLMTR